MSLLADNEIRLGEVGKNVIIQTGGYNVAGGTVNAIIQNPDGTRHPYAAAINADNVSVTIVSTVAMFPAVGNYSVQLQFTKGAFAPLIGMQTTITVVPAL